MIQQAMFCTVGIYSLTSLPKNLKLNCVNVMDTSVEKLVHIGYGKNIIHSYLNVQYSSFVIISAKRDLIHTLYNFQYMLRKKVRAFKLSDSVNHSVDLI